MINKLVTFLLLLFIVTPSFGDAWQDCAKNIIQDGEFAQNVRDIVGDDRNDAQKILQSRASDIRFKLVDKMFSVKNGLCKNEIVDIARMKTLKLSFDVDGKIYRFDIDVDTLFDYFPTQTAIMVYNDRSKKIWDQITNDSIKSLYWSDECSDHTIWENLDDSAAVNVAGQQIFTEYGGTKNEFFLDFEKGNNQRAFPGLVIEDVTGNTEENLVLFTHLPTALKKFDAFAKNLENTTCGNQGLAVYLVSVAGTPDSKNNINVAAGKGFEPGGGTGRNIGAGVGIGIGVPVLAGMTTAALGATTTGAIMSFGLAAAGTMNPVGWIVGGVALVAGGIIALVPTDIADIKQVYVLYGPYIIR
mgnify:CR=1 FL=1